MHFLKTFLVSALATAAAAQLQFTSFPPSSVTAGQGSYSLTYRTAEGKVNTPVTIELRKGPSGNLGVVSTLTTSAVGGVFVFKPSKNLVDGNDYALSIEQSGSAPNYTPQFSVSGGSSSSSSSSSATSSASGSSSISSSSTAAPYPVTGGNSTSGVAGASAVGTGTAVGTVGTGSPTIARNTTFSSATIAPSTSTVGGGSGSGSGASATAQQSSVSTGAATRMDSSVALVFGILGAFAYLN